MKNDRKVKEIRKEKRSLLGDVSKSPCLTHRECLVKTNEMLVIMCDKEKTKVIQSSDGKQCVCTSKSNIVGNLIGSLL